MSIPNTFFGQTTLPNALEECQPRYVRLDVYIQPLNAQRTIELGWVALKSSRSHRNSDNGIVLVDHRSDHAFLVDGCHVLPSLKQLCESLGLQLRSLGVAVVQEPAQSVGFQQEFALGPLTTSSTIMVPCRGLQPDGSVRCQLRVYTLPNDVPEALSTPLSTPVSEIFGTSSSVAAVAAAAVASPTSSNFHSTEEVVKILRPSLADQQSITRQRVKGITDRSRLCKELRNAVPSHLKKRKNRRAVIKTLQDLEEYMGSIDPVFEVCGNNSELCMTAARTIGLSNTRFVELRRMWEAYQEEKKAENHEILELGPQKDACTLRKLVAILERYGWSCTSGQPRANEDISKPPRPPTSVESPNWMGALRKRPSLSVLSAFSDSEDYESDFSPKRPRSECCSSEEGNTSDEGEQFATPELVLPSMFENKFANEATFMEDKFFFPGWATERDSNSSEIPDIVFNVSDVDIFNEIEKELLAEFL